MLKSTPTRPAAGSRGASSATSLVLTKSDISRVLRLAGVDRLMDEVIDALGRSLLDFSEEEFRIKKRDGFSYLTPSEGVFEWMPLLQTSGRILVKHVGYNPSNPTLHGLPTIISTLGLHDLHTGRLLALTDGTFLTALRTGAASAVASRALARPDSRVVGLIGCGAQAVTQLHALSRVFPVETALAYDTDPEASHSFAGRTSFLGIDVRVVARGVVEAESDIICTATSAAVGGGPVLLDRDLRAWVHVNAVGSDLPGKIELPRSLLERSLVCPDFLEQALVEGECQQLAPHQIGPTLVELVRSEGKYIAHRHAPTVFDSTGFALEDLVALDVLLAHAREYGLGTPLAIENLRAEAKNPYAALYEDEPF